MSWNSPSRLGWQNPWDWRVTASQHWACECTQQCCIPGLFSVLSFVTLVLGIEPRSCALHFPGQWWGCYNIFVLPDNSTIYFARRGILKKKIYTEQWASAYCLDGETLRSILWWAAGWCPSCDCFFRRVSIRQPEDSWVQ